MQVVVTRILLEGDQGAAEWTWSETNRVDGSRHTVEDAIIFELRDAKLVSWREYFDTFATQDTIAGERTCFSRWKTGYGGRTSGGSRGSGGGSYGGPWDTDTCR